MAWEKLSQGVHNTVYIDKQSNQVFKICKKNTVTDAPLRAARVWNELNSKYGQASLYAIDLIRRGWVCPFIEGSSPSDHEIAVKLIEIFNETGRIVLDASVSGNFIKTEDNEIVCVDVGQALNLQEINEIEYDDKKRRNSTASLQFWSSVHDKLPKFFAGCMEKHGETIDTVKALLFIKMMQPLVCKVNFLYNNRSLVKFFASGYNALIHLDHKFCAQAKDKLEILEKSGQVSFGKDTDSTNDSRYGLKTTVNLLYVITECQDKLEEYVLSRGYINNLNEFVPNFFTKNFRNLPLTSRKVRHAMNLFDEFNRIKSRRESTAYDQVLTSMQTTIENAKKANNLLQGVFTRGLEKALVQCEQVITNAKNIEKLTANTA